MKVRAIVFTLLIFFFNSYNVLAENYCGDGIVNSWPDPDIENKTTKWVGVGNASELGNWSNGIPVKNDIVIFNSTSTSNCNWDLDLSITGLTINVGYTGTINMVSNLNIDIAFIDEECDDGNTNEEDECLSDCTIRHINDGITQIYLGEECDPQECNNGKRQLDCFSGRGYEYENCSVVYKAGDVPCTTPYGEFGDYYIDYDGEGLDLAIHHTSHSYRKRTVVCPGEYVGNYAWYRGINSQLVAWSSPTLNINQLYETITAQNFSNNIDYMNDTILKSRNGNTTLYISTGGYDNGVYPFNGRVSGFRITGATNSTCPVWINSAQGYETGEPCAGMRYYCTESHKLDHMLFEGNNVGVFVKDTDPEWDFDIRMTRIVSTRNDIGVRWKYGNGNTLQFSDIIGNYEIGLEVIDAKFHIAKLNSFKDNPTAIMLRNERYSVTQANQGVLLVFNNIYNGTLIDYCGPACYRFYYNWLNGSSSSLNWDPVSSAYDWLNINYVNYVDGCSL